MSDLNPSPANIANKSTKKLKASEQQILDFIASKTDNKALAIDSSNQEIADALGVSKTTVQRGLSSLVTKGYLVCEKRAVGEKRSIVPLFLSASPEANNNQVRTTLAHNDSNDTSKLALSTPEQAPAPTSFNYKGFVLPAPFESVSDIKQSFIFGNDMRDFFKEPLKFNLAPMMQKAGLSDKLQPFGKPHNWSFDFSNLGKALRPTKKSIEATKKAYPEHDGFHYGNERFSNDWKEFFIFYACVELANFSNECFANTVDFESSDLDLDIVFYKYFQGFLAECLNANSFENTPKEFISRMKRSYNPTSKGELGAYLVKSVQNEVISLLSTPDTANKCLDRFKANFVKYVNGQRFIADSNAVSLNSINWLNGIWGPDLSKNLLHSAIDYIPNVKGIPDQNSSYLAKVYFAPRLSYPLILFRSLVSLTLVSNVKGLTQDNEDIAIACLFRSFILEQYQQLVKLVEVFKSDFSFFNKVNMEALRDEFFK